MTIVAFIAGWLITGVIGYMAVLTLAARHPVLHPMERVVWGLLLGPIICMYSAFFLLWIRIIDLSLSGFLIALLLPIVPIMIVARRVVDRKKIVANGAVFVSESNTKKWQKIVMATLLSWIAVKITLGAAVLISTPPYWDDTFNNWNLRGKIIHEYQTLDILSEEPGTKVIGKEATGSYPPMVPMYKAWFAALNGEWNEGLINSMHVVWFVLMLCAFYFFMRRHVSAFWSVVGVYAIVSLPLVFMQGVNPYIDVFVASIVLLGSIALYQAAISEGMELRGWISLGVLAMGLLCFVKNEAIVLYIPLYALIIAALLYWKHKRMYDAEVIHSTIIAWIIALDVILPWFIFKLMNGLTFGNAKAVSQFDIAYSPEALTAIWMFLSHEANFLFLPIAMIIVLVMSRRFIVRAPYVFVLAFLLLAIAEQMGIYLYTPLATEAINQTGLGRGFTHLAPSIVLLGSMLIIRLRSARS